MMSWSLKPIAKFEGRKYRKKLLKLIKTLLTGNYKRCFQAENNIYIYIYIYIYTHHKLITGTIVTMNKVVFKSTYY